MVRQTREQIDAQIVDRACGLFARHGYQHTSLQQVADEVGYSKTGLLHRFASKDAIYRAAVRAARETTEALATRTHTIPAGAERDRALMEAILQTTWDRPGIAAFLFSTTNSSSAEIPELMQAGIALAGAFGLGAGDVQDARLVRILSATAGLHTAALEAARQKREQEWRRHIIAAAMDALGHRGEPRPADL